MVNTEVVFPSDPGKVNSRETWIDAVRGVAIIMVVLGHVIQFGAHDQFDVFENPIFVTIYSFHMPLFVLVSGYLARRSITRYGFGHLVWQRARGLLLPFAVWTVVGGASLAVARELLDGWQDPLAPLVAVGRGFLYPETSLWFLWVMFCCYLLAALACLSPGRLWMGASAALWMVVMLLPMDSVLAVTQLKWLFPYFIAGMLARDYRRLLKRWELIGTGSAIAAFLGMLFLWQRQDSVYISRMSIGDRPLLEGILVFGYRYGIALAGAVAVIGVVRLFARRSDLRVLSTLGVSSLGVYAVQTFPVTALNILPSPADSAGTYFALYVPLVTAVILTTSFIVVRYLFDRYRITRVLLLGGR